MRTPGARIHLRTRVGARHGWGNLYRLAALATELRDVRGVEPVFFVEGDRVAERVLARLGFPFVLLPEGIDLAAEVAELAAHRRAALCVVEMLDLDLERQRMLRENAGALLVMDDLLDQRYDADLVIGGQEVGGESGAVLATPATRVATGYSWFVVGDAIRKSRRSPESLPQQIQRLLVAFGGGRYDAAWIKAAQGIARWNSAAACSFVLGPAEAPGMREGILSLLPQARIVGEGDLAMEFATHDCALTSAGYLKIEAAATGTPALAMATQWHQIPIGARFAERMGVPFLGPMAYASAEQIAKALAELDALERRREIAQRGLELIDGEGVKRVAEAAMELIGVPVAGANT